jgi:hypothetical protein
LHSIGKAALILGALATLVGLVGGFGFLFNGYDERAKLLLGMIPPAFLLVFVGIVMTLLGDSKH